MARLLLLLVAGMILTTHASLIPKWSLSELEQLDVEEKADLGKMLIKDKKYLINGEKFGADDFDEDPTEIIDGELKSDEKDDPALSSKPGEKNYLVNGKELGAEDFDEDPTEIIDGEVKSDEMDAPTLTVWIRNNNSWCTLKGRQFLSGEFGVVQTLQQCRAQCDKKKGCKAIELWHAYNWNCYWCTNPDLIEPYTYTKDLAYPPYVWVKTKWRKHPFSWCTAQGRTILSGEVGVEQTFEECADQCYQKEGCNAIELWHAYNWNCYWCTDTGLIEPYTYTSDLAYPAHVWVRIDQ